LIIDRDYLAFGGRQHLDRFSAARQFPSFLALAHPLAGLWEIDPLDVASERGRELVDTDAGESLTFSVQPRVTLVVAEFFGDGEPVNIGGLEEWSYARRRICGFGRTDRVLPVEQEIDEHESCEGEDQE
jgi:hypothetical protein